MTGRDRPNVFSVPVGTPFLPALVEATLSGDLLPGGAPDSGPLALADITIFVPTRRAARTLRAAFLDALGGGSAILPRIRPLGEFEDDAGAFDAPDALELAPPIGALERILALAPLVQAWKNRLPAHVRARFGEDVVVPASTADAIWLARDLAALMDEVEAEDGDWSRLADLVPADLAGWWQVTLDFLTIVTEYFPAELASRSRSGPAAHLSAMIDAEARRLANAATDAPVIAAGSTGSIPATARLLSVIARLPNGAVVLPGLDLDADDRSWSALAATPGQPAVLGHPQHGLARLIAQFGIQRSEVRELGRRGPALASRARFVSDALRPAETTDLWATTRAATDETETVEALSGISVVEAANEHEEALAIAIALRRAVGPAGRRAALVTPDRALARRVAVELRRFGIEADDSGGRPLENFSAALLLKGAVDTALQPGDPVALLSLLKNPLLRCGMQRGTARRAAEIVELVALRGGVGRPDVCDLPASFDIRLSEVDRDQIRPPFWRKRLSDRETAAARDLAARMAVAVRPLAALRGVPAVPFGRAVAATVEALENLGREEGGGLGGLYGGDAGEALVRFLRELAASAAGLEFAAAEWPAMLPALMSGATVKPPHGADARVAIWGALEARLQHVDTLVLGGLNEGSWPHRATADRFMSRLMKSGLDLKPPERRIGQAAHDFWMASGMPEVVLTRAVRTEGAPSVASRWLQRLATYAGDSALAVMKARGETLARWARAIDRPSPVDAMQRPRPTPPLAARPTRFSVTEVETLRRDPYAVYARRILDLRALEPVVRDPGAAERGTLFHDILHEFIRSGTDPRAADAEQLLLQTGRLLFDKAGLPADVDAVWWPRFAALARSITEWERNKRPPGIKARLTEAAAVPVPVGASGATLHGRADRIDLLAGGQADILDYKTGSYPSLRQAHTLVTPQLALEAALLARGAFAEAGSPVPRELAYVRLRPNGEVKEESILEYRKNRVAAAEIADEAWRRLELLAAHYADPANGYISRALPFREGDVEGDYDHLARVLEWSASAGGEAGE